MKKLIAALTLMLAFSINANAQDKNTQVKTEQTAYDLGKKQAIELTEFLSLEKDQTENFARLFEQKINTLNDINLTQERRDEYARVIDAKLRGSLNQKQIEKLDSNKELLKRLTH